jgi:hypothetical protein
MPTVYRFAKKSLSRNRVASRDLEIWLKHCEQKGIDPAATMPVNKHPHGAKKTP